MKLLVKLALSAAMTLGSVPALWAADVALILTNRDYGRLGSEREAFDYNSLAKTFRRAGFETYGGQDWTVDQMAASVQSAQQRAIEDPGRFVIVLSGRIVSAHGDSWLLGRNYSAVNEFNVGQMGVSVNAINAVLSDHPARALLVTVPSFSRRLGGGTGLSIGMHDLTPAQGVAAMTGPFSQVMASLNNQVLRGGFPLGQVAQSAPSSVQYSGFLPMDLALGGVSDPVDQGDSAYWSAVRDIGSLEAYRAYLNRFPNGLFVAEARRQVDALDISPADQAQAIETALGLNRAQRRDVQRKLTLIGFDTRGIDGLFGRGTRRAIADFQRSQGQDPHGFLSADLLVALDEAARQAEAEASRQDQLYWRRTGASGREVDLRAYLDRYPQGEFAELARQRLLAFGPSEAEIQSAWRRARDIDTIATYETFLRDYPGSAQAAQADARLQELRARQSEINTATQRDRADERAVASNPVSILLVERGLARAGFNPGPIDGNLDNTTRDAIRLFQESEGLVPTGYVSQATMLRLTIRASR